MVPGSLMLLRHGESVANARSLFTGVLNVDLTPSGERDCALAGARLRHVGFRPTLIITSWLVRGWRTAELVAGQIGYRGGIERHWELNERNYGALSGLQKAEVRERYGQESFLYWRRSYAGRPPPLPESTLELWRRLAPFDRLPPEALVATESLRDVVARIEPWWHRVLQPALAGGEDLLVVAHGNSLRALCAVIDDLDEREVSALNLPNARPLLYRFTSPRPDARENPRPDPPGDAAAPGLTPTRRGGEYLDPAEARREAAIIAAQGGT